MISPTPPRTFSGRRFVRVLIVLLACLLIYSFAGWFWTKANRSPNQIGVPVQYPDPLKTPRR